MTKTLQEIKNEMKRLVEDTDIDRIDNTVYVLNCDEELTGYTSLIGYFPTLETAKEAAKRDLAANGNREDVLHYSVDLYTYKDTITL